MTYSAFILDAAFQVWWLWLAFAICIFHAIQIITTKDQ